MTRDEELTAQATRVQQRGPITDYFGCGPLPPGDRVSGRGRLALCRCVHGREWPEGDWSEEKGGKACRECVIEWHAEWMAKQP